MKSSTPMTVVATEEKTGWNVFSELVKLRLTSLVLLTTFVGFYLGQRGRMDYGLMLNTMFGTALLAAGAAALNQLLEQKFDAKMRRTEQRPLPSGKIKPISVLLFGGAISGVGLIYLVLAVNLITGFLGVVALVSYLFIYTPLKRVTTLNTIIGAIPGALPPLMGWTAARGEITIEGWSLFAILFFWQLPHFLAIAWIYREDYLRAGFIMLPAVDSSGQRTGRQTISHTLGLLPVSLTPFLFKMVGPAYFLGAFLLGVVFLIFAIRFAREMSLIRARHLFFASVIYLPLLLSLMVFDKVSY